jgi:aspartyl-tRNA(Asn)/glutamyl-tRNA(Gln) amidotransferase subunit A
VPLSLPHTHYGVATYYVLATAEASSNLARFDGVRFGLRVERPGSNLGNLYTESRTKGFGPEVQRRILLGTYVLSSGFYDAYYSKAQRVRTLIARDFERAFQQVDCLLAPTSPTVAFRLGERSHDPLAMYMADVYTLPASLAGIPALSLPVGNATSGGKSLPVGMQVMAPLDGEVTMFRAAGAIEELCRE